MPSLMTYFFQSNSALSMKKTLHIYFTFPCFTLLQAFCTPLWKSNRNFFQNQIWSGSLDINILCLVCVKRSTGEVKKCQISKCGYQQGPSDEALKKARCQFCDVKFGHRIMEAWASLTIKCAILPKSLLISQTCEPRVLFYDLLI